MRDPLKPGDRVVAYECSKIMRGTVVALPRGVASFPDAVWIDLDNGTGKIAVHPKQCRRLRPKAKHAERLERWVNVYKGDPTGNAAAHKTKEMAIHMGGQFERTAHLQEVKPGERIVSREELAKAWDAMDPDSIAVDFRCNSENSRTFKELARLIGFGGSDGE